MAFVYGNLHTTNWITVFVGKELEGGGIYDGKYYAV